MQSALDRSHSEMFLKTHNVGRLGCSVDNRPYIIPVSYVYDGNCIYGHTNDGKKLKMMRENPTVCFEVDEIKDFSQWKSVICWGQYEELEGEEMARALDMMINRLTPFSTDSEEDAHSPPSDELAHQIRLRTSKGATYRIHIDEMTGRFERP